VIVIQVVPPIPPRIPMDPNLIVTSLDPPAIVMVVLLVMAACTIVLWPLARALARRLEGRGSQDAILRAEVDALHNRLADVDALQARLGELEERLDFAERIIARGESAPAQLPRRGS
jgi:Tfp pilus assembly protein PilO